MTVKIVISSLLLVIAFILSLKHGWDAFQPVNPEQAQMMADLGIGSAVMPYFGLYSIMVGLMLLFPQTFFVSNLLSSITIVWIIALALNAGNIKMALIEIPFLTMHFIMIYLKHPLKN